MIDENDTNQSEERGEKGGNRHTYVGSSMTMCQALRLEALAGHYGDTESDCWQRGAEERVRQGR